MTVATAAIAAQHHRSSLRRTDRQNSSRMIVPCAPLQKSKLIIFFMTITPIDIQTAEAAEHHAARAARSTAARCSRGLVM